MDSEEELFNYTYILSHYNDYLKDILNDKIIDNTTIKSNKLALTKYYKERIIISSEMLDPYAVVNNSNDDLDMTIPNSIIEHFSRYLDNIINDHLNNNAEEFDEGTINSILLFIKYYYEERNDLYSILFDKYAYINNSNDDILDILEDYESIWDNSNNNSNNSSNNSSTTCSDTENEKYKDKYIDEFLNNINFKTILLYKKNNTYQDKLKHFLQLNTYY